eukprot:c27556_g1_i5 orf=310-486(-)
MPMSPVSHVPLQVDIVLLLQGGGSSIITLTEILMVWAVCQSQLFLLRVCNGTFTSKSA